MWLKSGFIVLCVLFGFSGCTWAKSKPESYYKMTTAQIEDMAIKLERGNSSYAEVKESFDKMPDTVLTNDPADTDSLVEFFKMVSRVKLQSNIDTQTAKDTLFESEYLAKWMQDRNKEPINDLLSAAESYYWKKDYKNMELQLFWAF